MIKKYCILELDFISDMRFLKNLKELFQEQFLGKKRNIDGLSTNEIF